MGEGKLGPYRLAPGIRRSHALVLLYTSFSVIGLVTFVNFANPYLFAVLGVAKEQQGQLASALLVLQESVVILIGGLIGALSDRRGRRRILVAGLLLVAAGFVIYPLAATALQLVLLRGFYAFGYAAATTMITTCAAEYVDNRSRGRWIGTLGVCNGLGVVVMATVCARLPQVLAARGFDQASAIRTTFWVFAAYLLALAALAAAGLRGGLPDHPAARSSLWRQTTAGLRIGRENPRVALAYATAFAARGDLVVLTTFVTLWIIQAGVAAGMTPSQATARAGMVFGTAQGVGLLWALAVGYLFDRVPRLVAVACAFGFCALGYALLGFTTNPFGPWILPAAICASVGEASAIVAGGVLIGQEAPAVARGVVVGTFVVMGSIGQILLTVVSGQVFDRLGGGGGPFLVMAAVNLAVALFALKVLRRPQPAASST
jgi:MFS family permease